MIYERAVILEGSAIGDNVTIMPGVVIGGQGYGCVRRRGRVKSLFHRGGASIGNGVYLGPRVSVDRALKNEQTIIGDGSVLISAIHVAHNARIGRCCSISSGSMIAGYCTIGDRACIGSNSSIVNRIEIGSDAVVGDGAVVTRSVESGTKVSGNFALPSKRHTKWMEAISGSEEAD